VKCKNEDCDREVTRQFHVFCNECFDSKTESAEDGNPGKKYQYSTTQEEFNKMKKNYKCGACDKPASPAYGKNTMVLYKGYGSTYLRCKDCDGYIERKCPQCGCDERRKLSTILTYKEHPRMVPCNSCKTLQKLETQLANPSKIIDKYRPGSGFKSKYSQVHSLMSEVEGMIDGWSKRRDVHLQDHDVLKTMVRKVRINQVTGPKHRRISRTVLTQYYRSWNRLLAEYEEKIQKNKKYSIVRIEIDTWKKEKQVNSASGKRTDVVYNYPIKINYWLRIN
jgi:hypothetical protein